jgi:transcriptional regulator of acetoin/glycerol metabolism
MGTESVAMGHARTVLTTVDSGTRAATSSIAASWCRSALRFGLDPSSGRRHERLDDADLTHLMDRRSDLMEAAAPVLASLFGSVHSTGCCVILADTDGVVLDARSSVADQVLFDAIGLGPGANWSEAAEGTNGIGTCLIEQRPMIIDRAEHFSSRNIGVSCIDAPVWDSRGDLIAALDITTGTPDAARTIVPLVTPLVQEAARQIERSLFCQQYANGRIIYTSDELGRGSSLLAVDKDDLLIGATRSARRAFGISQTQIDAPTPVSDILGLEHPARFEDSERMILRQAMARARGNVSTAARSLGISRATFYRRMERAGLNLNRSPRAAAAL